MYTKVEYIWIDENLKFHSKTRIFHSLFNTKPQITKWSFYNDSEQITLKPLKVYNDPFERKNHLLVLCESFEKNSRIDALNIFEYKKYLEPTFEIEQEFLVVPIYNFYNNNNDNIYCPIGSEYAFGREFLTEVIDNCLYSGMKIISKNLQDSFGKMRIKIEGDDIDASDQLMIMRYILLRTSEKFNYEIKFIKCFYEFNTKHIRDNNKPSIFYYNDENNNNSFYITSKLFSDNCLQI